MTETFLSHFYRLLEFNSVFKKKSYEGKQYMACLIKKKSLNC